MLKIFFFIAFATIHLKSYSNEYVINVSESVSYNLGKQQITSLFDQIYQPLGIKPRYIYLPSLRGLELVSQGIYAAEAGRIASIGDSYSQLIKVPTPLTTVHLTLFCIEKQYCQLDKKLGFLVISGSLFPLNFCQQNQLDCNIITNDHSAFTALKKHHADAILGNSLFPKGALCDSGLKHVYSRVITTQALPLHHFVHKDYQGLVNDINQAILKLKSDGSIDKLFEQLANDFNQCGGAVTELPAI